MAMNACNVLNEDSTCTRREQKRLRNAFATLRRGDIGLDGIEDIGVLNKKNYWEHV